MRGWGLLVLKMQSIGGLYKNHDPCRGVVCGDVNTPNGVAAETLYVSRDATYKMTWANNLPYTICIEH